MIARGGPAFGFSSRYGATGTVWLPLRCLKRQVIPALGSLIPVPNSAHAVP